MANVKPIPFTIDRNLMVNFAEQMAEGFRDAIRRGYYRAGDMLPRQDEIAKSLGVSIRIPREAYRILERDRCVRPRRGFGCEVVGRNESVWKGRILLVYQSESEGSYSQSVFLGSVRRCLAKHGYLVSLGGIDHSKSGKPDFSTVVSMLHSSYDLVLAYYPRRKCRKILDGCGMPVVYSEDIRLGGEGGVCAASLAPLSERCLEIGVRRVMLVGYWPIPCVEKHLKGHGFEVETVMLKGNPGPNYLERLTERSMRMFCRRFERRTDRPDLVLCIDDYVARGALAAFAHLGVRMPNDVRFVTLANRGNAPVSAVHLARIEYDPRLYGTWVAEAVLARMRGATPPPEVPMTRFIDAASLSGTSR